MTVFENLKAMIEAEASMRRKSRKKKRNKIKTQENETGQKCFICRETEHLVNDCPQTDQGNNMVSYICLWCGDSGHDMFSCEGDYLANDLKEIQYYVCKSFGHLCCFNSSNIDLKQVYCYNCRQSGRLGPECTESCEVPDGMKSDVICYKCGKEGHFARRCGGHFKTTERLPSQAKPSQNFQRLYSTPRSLGKAQGRVTIYKRENNYDCRSVKVAHQCSLTEEDSALTVPDHLSISRQQVQQSSN